MMMMEHVLETGSITSSRLSGSILYCPAIIVPKTVTKVNDKQDRSNIDVLTMAPKILKVCTFSATTAYPPDSSFSSFSSTSGSSCNFPDNLEDNVPDVRMTDGLLSSLVFASGFPETLTRPPNRKDMPKTSSTFESTEPSKVAFTTAYKPPRRVCTVMTISTALPNVALISPAKRSFRRPAASSSVMSPRIFAIGNIAKKLSQKVYAEFHLA
mmetsp:Transcript_33738/g.41535  ORF Transcript_33738/g.41535 Transcript_33738/m.41535 type:complete len:212 (-) Transcript_33738:187-822(-)